MIARQPDDQVDGRDDPSESQEIQTKANGGKAGLDVWKASAWCQTVLDTRLHTSHTNAERIHTYYLRFMVDVHLELVATAARE